MCAPPPSRSSWLDISCHITKRACAAVCGIEGFRIMGCYNRLGRATWDSSFPQHRLYKLLSSYRRTYLWSDLVFATSRCLCRLRSLLHPKRQRAPTNGRASLRNHSPLWSCTGEGQLGFWEALCTIVQVLHRHLLRPVFSNIVINNIIVATSSANEWYVLKEICPRGNNNIVIIIFLVHDNVYTPCYNCIKWKH
jgi:hypothetical protein